MRTLFASLFLVLGLAALGAQTRGSISTGAEDIDPVIQKSNEISVFLPGVFLNNYMVHAERSIHPEGLMSLGIRANYFDVSILSVGYTGYQVLGGLRLYPARWMRGFYANIEAGYGVQELRFDEYSGELAKVPLLAGIGWKWVINEFSIDVGGLAGRATYLGDAPEEMNTFPLNTAFDYYVLFGYRF